MDYYQTFANVIYWIDDNFWGYPFIFFVLFVGAYYFFGSKLFTISHLNHIFHWTFGQVISKEDSTEKQKAEGRVSPFEAACIAIGGCVGSGNIAGVASAIAVGGPGSVLWLEIWAFFGMMVKLVEISLSCYYRSKNEKGEYYGGTPFMVEKGLVRKRGHKAAGMTIAILFAFGFWFQFLGGSQAYSISEALNYSFGIDMFLVTVLYSIVLYYVIWHGTPRIAAMATRLVPFMCIAYLIGTIVLIFANVKEVPHAFYMIFHDAFTGTAAAGGFVGSGIRLAMTKGISRSMNSNEAGQGSSPLIHGSSNTIHPVREGLWGSFEVFTDTIIVCTCTALAVICTGEWTSGKTGATLTIVSFESVFGVGGKIFIGVMMALFGITTTAGWFTYYISVIQWIFRKHPVVRDRICLIFKFIFPIPNLIIVWSVSKGGFDANLFWAIVDITLLIPVFTNLLAMFLLRNDFWPLFRDYKARYMGIGEVDPNFYVFYEDDPEVFKVEEANREELRRIDEEYHKAKANG
ncbi:MAG: sodium:alanine symporter family protein [Eubacteriales bacterium]|nr:sodium:alanine symporter family protein [Eubacteriales bacterium]